MVALHEIIAALESAYDPRWAAPWDAVGLVCGDPERSVRRVLFAIDPVRVVVDEALASDADLLVTHHPLFLTAVHGVPADDPKGNVVHRLIEGRCALFVAHTNADVARPGVSDALAQALGLIDVEPLEPDSTEKWDKIVVFVPTEDAGKIIDALAATGAGRYGDYDRCAWTVTGEGTFRPGPGSAPVIGRPGEIERVPEARVEMVVPHASRTAAVSALRAAHPYEEPAFDVVPLDRSVPATRGTGRVGRLPTPARLDEFVRRVAESLPATTSGVRATGDPAMRVERVAVCGGSGGSYAEQARRAGADAYVTADMRHHPASELTESSADGRPFALVDVAHWASEWPWLPAAADRLRKMLGPAAGQLETRCSTPVTDPWTVHVPSAGPPSP